MKLKLSQLRKIIKESILESDDETILVRGEVELFTAAIYRNIDLLRDFSEKFDRGYISLSSIKNASRVNNNLTKLLINLSRAADEQHPTPITATRSNIKPV